MGVKERVFEFINSEKISIKQFEERCDLSNGYVSSMRKGFGSIKLDNVLREFPKINREWLLYGEGEMLKTDEQPGVNYECSGVPYYDVDFIGGFDLVLNDQTVNPDYHINFKQYNNADFWVNVTGHSMEPEVSHGDIIALKELSDWNTHLLYGEMYALITAENRTVKYIRKSSKGEDWIKLVPVNTMNYDEQDIPKSAVKKVFKVLGCAKRLQ